MSHPPNGPPVPRVAAHMRLATSDGKSPKAAPFHPFSTCKRGGYYIEDGSHDGFDVPTTQMRICGRKFRDESRSGQRAPRNKFAERCQTRLAPSTRAAEASNSNGRS
jgi:hypothetical protein